MDWAPTLVELTGSRPIEDVDGQSIAPLLRDEVADEPAPPWDEGFAEQHGSRFALTARLLWHGHHKYVFNAYDMDELYDLERDPEERHNLAEDPAYANLARALAYGIPQATAANMEQRIRDGFQFLMPGVGRDTAALEKGRGLAGRQG